MADAVGYQFPASGGVEFPVFIEEILHHHAPQLGDAFLLIHPLVEIIHFLVNAVGSTAATAKTKSNVIIVFKFLIGNNVNGIKQSAQRYEKKTKNADLFGIFVVYA